MTCATAVGAADEFAEPVVDHYLLELTVSTEPMAAGRLMITVFSASIPDLEGRSRAVVMDNIGRAFPHAGWTMIAS